MTTTSQTTSNPSIQSSTSDSSNNSQTGSSSPGWTFPLFILGLIVVMIRRRYYK